MFDGHLLMRRIPYTLERRLQRIKGRPLEAQQFHPQAQRLVKASRHHLLGFLCGFLKDKFKLLCKGVKLRGNGSLILWFTLIYVDKHFLRVLYK
jgi:hypothetical protein